MARGLALTLLFATVLISPSPSAASAKANVYVAHFKALGDEYVQLEEKFARDFIWAVVQAGCYQVLESPEIESLFTETERERAISDVNQISDKVTKALELQHADMVAFGEIYDDIDSGSFDVAVKLLKFDRTTPILKKVQISRGKINDASTRQYAMRQLAQRVCAEERRRRGSKPGLTPTKKTLITAGPAKTVIDASNLDRYKDRSQIGAQTLVFDNVEFPARPGAVFLANRIVFKSTAKIIGHEFSIIAIEVAGGFLDASGERGEVGGTVFLAAASVSGTAISVAGGEGPPGATGRDEMDGGIGEKGGRGGPGGEIQIALLGAQPPVLEISGGPGGPGGRGGRGDPGPDGKVCLHRLKSFEQIRSLFNSQATTEDGVIAVKNLVEGSCQS